MAVEMVREAALFDHTLHLFVVENRGTEYRAFLDDVTRWHGHAASLQSLLLDAYRLIEKQYAYEQRPPSQGRRNPNKVHSDLDVEDRVAFPDRPADLRLHIVAPFSDSADWMIEFLDESAWATCQDGLREAFMAVSKRLDTYPVRNQGGDIPEHIPPVQLHQPPAVIDAKPLVVAPPPKIMGVEQAIRDEIATILQQDRKLVEQINALSSQHRRLMAEKRAAEKALEAYKKHRPQ